jgi:prolyl oligopeptidase
MTMTTPRRPVTKTIGSVTFEDPYDWLQHDSTEALAWQWEQDEVAEREARSWPHFETLKAQIRASEAGYLLFARTPPRLHGKRWFWAAPGPQGSRVVWTADSLDDPGRPVFDLADHVAADDAASASVLWWEPSPDGGRVAAIVCLHGDMMGQWHVFDTATGDAVRAPLPAIGYSGAIPGWLADGSGFYLHGRDPEGLHRIAFVALDDGVAERPARTFDFAEVPAMMSGLSCNVSPDDRWVIADSGPHERTAFVIGDTITGEWRRFLPDDYEGELTGGWLDAETYVARAHGDDSPRGRIVAIPAATSQDRGTWREIAPHGQAVIRALGTIRGRIVVAELVHVSLRIRVIDPADGSEKIVPIAPHGASWISGFHRFDRSQALTFDYSTFSSSAALYHYDIDSGALETIVAPERTIEGIAVSQHFARSQDGTRVPYYLVHRADLDFDRPQPALITGYGGFNSAFVPAFLSQYAPFVQAGGVLIHTNIRGGGDYGKAWHDGARFGCKWNSYLDLFAISEAVIADGITSADRLAMTGASNGGLLAGAAIVHRPDLYRAVVPDVPIFDMMEPLPYTPELEPIRAIFWQDYGDPRDAVMSKVIYSYSPYHNVRDGIAYPAVFSVFGEKDVGCMPFHGRKFTARLQGATSSGHRVLMRTWKDTAHGSLDAETSINQRAEWLGFLMAELGMVPVER